MLFDIHELNRKIAELGRPTKDEDPRLPGQRTETGKLFKMAAFEYLAKNNTNHAPKYCCQCKRLRPFDPHAKLQSKASGFAGLICWDCHITKQRQHQQWNRGYQV